MELVERSFLVLGCGLLRWVHGLTGTFAATLGAGLRRHALPRHLCNGPRGGTTARP